MIASLRGLAILAVLAVVLSVLFVAVPPRQEGPVERTIAPGFDLARDASELVFSWPGQPDAVLVAGTKRWSWKAPTGDAEPSAIDALASALRATWHRRGARDAAGAIRGEVQIKTRAGQTRRYALGQDLAGAGQTWLVDDRGALLVDGWVANALVPTPVSLRLRHPGANAAASQAITADTLKLEGTHRVAPSEGWIDPDARRELVEALADLEIVALPPPGPRPPPQGTPVTIVLGPSGAELSRWATCAGGRILLAASTGDGCVESAGWQRVDRALARLGAGLASIADRRSLPIVPIRLESAGVVVDLAGSPRVGSEDADATRVAGLLQALAEPGEVVPRPAGAPTRTVVARDRDNVEVTLELYADRLARTGESIALEPPPEAWALIAQPLVALRDPVLWREDATTLATIELAGITYKRGAVLGEWLREPAGPVDASLVDALASALATVRAPSNPAAPTPLRLRVTFAPPAGKPVSHELLLGAPGHGGCPARVDGISVLADLSLCTAAHALAAAR